MIALFAEKFGVTKELKVSELKSLLSSVKEEMEDLKVQVQNTLLEHYSQFLPCYINTQQVEKKLVASTQDADTLLKMITSKVGPEMQSNLSEMRDIKKEMETLETSLLVINQYKEIYSHLQNLTAALIEEDYLASAESYTKAHASLNEGRSYGLEVDCVLQTGLVLKKEQLTLKLRQAWDKIISCNITEVKTVSIKVVQNGIPTQNILTTLVLINELDFVISNLSHFLFTSVFQPILQQSHSLEQSTDSNQTILTIKFHKTFNSKRPESEICLKTLKTILLFLNSSFLAQKVGEQSIFERVGSKVGKRLIEEVAKECLEYDVSVENFDMKRYSEMCSLFFAFNREVIEMGFLKGNEKTVLRSVGDSSLEEFVSDRMCQQFLSQARCIAKKDLYPMSHYSEEDLFKIPDVEGRCKNLDQTTEDLLNSKQSISRMFSFPTCKISDSIHEFIVLLEEIVCKAALRTDSLSLKYLCTSRLACDIYISLAYNYHRKSIEESLQLAAIFHNNCMFLANSLLLLAHKYRNMLSSISEVHFTFVDLTPQIRRLGTEKFLFQMKRQKSSIFEVLNESQVFENVSQDASLTPELEKVIHQCLHQFRALQKAWIAVLPSHVYLKVMGTLLDSTLEQFIGKVLNLTDISAKSSTTIATLFGTFLEEIKVILSLKEEQDISNYISSWDKCIGLKNLLEANLKEIVDRWSMGKGILASNFSKEEVKLLIRALFQNTEKRATALIQIR